jgi:ribosomal protein S18 acetylase RimI-like enzyme
MQYPAVDEKSLEEFGFLLGEVECGSEFSLANDDHAAWLARRLRCQMLSGTRFVGCCDDHGRVAGIVGVLVPTWPDLEHVPRVAELTHLIVAADHRRSGCATELVRRAETIASSLHAYCMYVRTAAVNRAAIALYERLGYVHTANLPDVYGPGKGEDVLYRKVL